jgi:nucleoside-specific outer membrane channel protein Tsx
MTTIHEEAGFGGWLRSWVIASATLMLCLSGPVAALQWQDNSLSYTFSNQFTEPGITEDVTKHIVEYVHVNGYSLGNNLFRAKVLRSGSEDPAESGDKGATEFYVVYRHLLSLGAITGESLAFGPVKDVGITAGFDVNRKNNTFGPRKRLLVLGPTLQFDVSKGSMFNLSLLLANERNECNLPPCLAPGAERRKTFDNYPIVHTAWRFPVQLGSWNTRFEGFALKGFRRGTDYVGKPWSDETLMRASWLVDVGGRLIGEKNTLFAGIGYELWRNKFGTSGLPGGNTDAPTLQLKWHF